MRKLFSNYLISICWSKFFFEQVTSSEKIMSVYYIDRLCQLILDNQKREKKREKEDLVFLRATLYFPRDLVLICSKVFHDSVVCSQNNFWLNKQEGGRRKRWPLFLRENARTHSGPSREHRKKGKSLCSSFSSSSYCCAKWCFCRCKGGSSPNARFLLNFWMREEKEEDNAQL